ncbi:MAG: glycosyltransferase family 2 protein, partial [Thermoplasmata archaeon]|nr:glycosyltransferase family 2 protein [Thermoplasmata archaeon]
MHPLGDSSDQARARPPERATGIPDLSLPSPLPAGDRARLLLLPTLDEAMGLRRTLEELREVPFRPAEGRPSVLVVDGASTDGTLEVADRWGVPVLQQSGRGKGAAVREGLEHAHRQGFRTVAVMDADGTYPADALPGIFNLLDDGADLVVGIRRPDATPLLRPRELVHRIGNGVLNFAAGEFSRRPVLDICSGFWALGADRVRELELRSDGFEIESELFIKAFRQRWRVAQVPVTYRPRIGQAKLHTIRDGARILLSILRHAQGRSLGARSGTGSGSRSNPLGALLLAMNPERIVLVADSGRLAEARQVGER